VTCMITPSRLTLARKRKGLTGKALAESAGITPVHLSRIEKGKAENIEDSTVEALARALGFPKQFFYEPDADLPSKDSASFRSLTAMTARERDSALSAGAVAYLFSEWVSDRFNLPALDLLDLSSEREPETAARELRAHWGLGERPLSNVVKLLESKGARVFSLSENNRNVDAFSCWRDGVPYIFLNTQKTSERSRFDALHELGHLVLHRHGKPQGREAEIEANRFASHFLMPSVDLVANVPFVTSLNQLVKAKKRWGVSVSALAYRLHKSGTLSDWQYRSFCIQINKKYRQSEPDQLPREASVVWDKIFKELWKEGNTRSTIAQDLYLPVEEINSLVFGLVETHMNVKATGKPALSLVSSNM
jgi:Zn-dependent peptidase ImmA (M78 family)/DNA-binding Xre family transcriptional regulator